MKAVVFQHMSSNGPGTLQKVLEEQGIECRIIHTACEDISSFDALAPDLLMVMGGSPGVYQADDFPFLKDEIRVLERRLTADRPTLGICLGAQLMAAALGAKVYKGTQGQEIGWFDLDITEAGKSSPARIYDKAQGKVMQWHGDTFDFPSSATLLATSELYPHQIFSYGRNAIAFQGHVEVTAEILADWYVGDAGLFVKHPEMLHKLREDTVRYAGGMTKATESFMKEWLAQVLPATGE